MRRYLVLDPVLKDIWREEYKNWTPEQRSGLERAANRFAEILEEEHKKSLTIL